MRILLAVDGSTYSQRAVDEVARRPWPPATTIRVLSVLQPYTPPAVDIVLAGATFEEIRQQQRSDAERLTAGAAAALASAGLGGVETAVREGDPRSEIVEEANSSSADLIVVGSHGRTGIERWVMGSVAESVVAHAPCSVEVVRQRRGSATGKRTAG